MGFKIRFLGMAAASALLASVLTSQCMAGAWTARKGSMYNKLFMNYYEADEYFDSARDSKGYAKNGEFRDFNSGYYVEYGLSDSLTLGGSLSFKSLRYEDDSEINRSTGFSDLDVSAKYRILETRGGAFSLQGLVKIPETYDEKDAVPMGNGQYDTEIRLLFGQSLYPVIPAYCNIEAGYRFRAEEPADEVRYLLELGTDFSKKCYGRIKLDGILGMENADDDAGIGGNPAATLDYDLGKLDMTVGYKMTEDTALEFGCRPDIYGKNTSSGVNWSLAYVHSFDPGK